MNKVEKLDQLDRAIKDCEIKLKSVQTNIENIDKEISVLSPRKAELEQNIRFHKKEGTVSIAHEFKKVRGELSKTKARLILITADRKKAIVAYQQIQDIVDKFKNDHMALLKTSENNVLRVLFGGNHGKE